LIRSYPKFEIDENLLKKREWREFWISDIFNEIKRGKRLIKANQKKGNVPYVSSSALNNGVDNFISNIEKVRIFENCLTIANSGSVGTSFYHPYKFVASDHVTHLKNNYFDKNIYLFISKIMNRLSQKYNFNREISDKRIIREKIILPVKNNKPDYEFMQSFIKEIEKLKLKRYLVFVKDKLKNLKYKEIPKLDEVEWSEFYLKNIGFKNYHGKRLIQSKRKNGDIPLITAGESNNGVADFISNEEMRKFKNVISVDMFGNSFYHPYICTGDDNIYFFENYKLSFFHKFFIVQMINKNKIKFSYGNQFRQPDADKLKIILPTKNNQPDFDYMEQFIKNMFIQKYKKYLNFIS
jgi:hypothetical protein